MDRVRKFLEDMNQEFSNLANFSRSRVVKCNNSRTNEQPQNMSIVDYVLVTIGTKMETSWLFHILDITETPQLSRDMYWKFKYG